MSACTTAAPTTPQSEETQLERSVIRRREVGRSDCTAEPDRIRSSARRIYDRIKLLQRKRGANDYGEFTAAMRSSLTPPEEKAQTFADIRYAQGTMISSKKLRDRLLDGAVAYLYGGPVLRAHFKNYQARIAAAVDQEACTDDEQAEDEEPAGGADGAPASSSDDDDDDGSEPGAVGLAVGIVA